MYIICGMFSLHRESKMTEGEITNVWLLNISLKHWFPWFGCGTSGDLAWMYRLHCRRLMWIWYLGGTQCSKPTCVTCEGNPAKPLILIVGNLDDPSTCKGLALQGIDTSVRKMCFWCELRNKSCLCNQGAWHARENTRKSRDRKQWSASMQLP